VPGYARTFKRVGTMTFRCYEDTKECREAFHMAVDWFFGGEREQIFLV
jgi:hypothetical protein